MDLTQILQSRRNRAERLGRPFKIFYDSFQQCAGASELVLERKLTDEVALLVERSVVITTVTAIEVFYKDLLALIFKACKPEFFEPHLKQLHSEKFDVGDLINFHKHSIHPLGKVCKTSPPDPPQRQASKTMAPWINTPWAWTHCPKRPARRSSLKR